MIGSTLLFLVGIEKEQEAEETFKDIKRVEQREQPDRGDCYYFSSEFGLLSDQHFINNFIRGYRPYSCYSKTAHAYTHTIHPDLAQTIQSLLPCSKL